MKTILSLSLLFFSSIIFAQTYSIKIDASYKAQDKNGLETSTEILVSKDKGNLIPIADNKNGIVLLGKVLAANKETITLEFLLQDRKNKEPLPIAKSQITATFGLLARTSQTSKTDQGAIRHIFTISLLASAPVSTIDRK